MRFPSPLPIDPVLPAVAEALEARGVAVLQAPPGAGKTTRVPLALLDASWAVGRKIVMLEPRRVAARAAARRMAETLGQPVGKTVGYRVRMDSRVGPETRIEVVTEGILTRMLQDDPALESCAALLFDEFHERSLNADLGLALALDSRGALRPDLRILVMSATLEGAPVARLLGDAPIVTSEGRAFPVETRWLDRPPAGRIEGAAADAIRLALREEEGDILAFLPGGREIRRTASLLNDVGGATVTPLYGDLPAEAQDRALRPLSDGRRKIVLATAIAETSLTIEGVRVVVDCGLARLPRFDPRGGMTRLETVRVSQAAAEQRRGRAGRTGPGICYRLWPEAEHRSLPLQPAPEITEADLAPLALDLALWGVADPGDLAWLNPPPDAAFSQAKALLVRLEALEGEGDGDGRITAHGRRMAALPVHPRLAHMILRAGERRLGGLACEVAALLEDRDVALARDADLRARVEGVRAVLGGSSAARAGVDPAAARRVAEQAKGLARVTGAKRGEGDPRAVGLALAFAYPDRIAQRRPGGDRRFRLANGKGAFFLHDDPLAAEDWLAVADLDGDRREARIFLAAPLGREEIEEAFANGIEEISFVEWDARAEAVSARRQRRLGALVLKDDPLADPPADRVAAALVDGVRRKGLAVLPWNSAARSIRDRIAFLRRVEGDEAWPDFTDEALLTGLDEWLAPWLAGMNRLSHLEKLDLAGILASMLDWNTRQRLDDHAPTHLTVPSGSRIPIDYSAEEGPVLAVRLQEMFGLAETPRVAAGRASVTLHLLSPARRPLQVTQDLAGFWRGSYKAVKAEMKGRYPKHYWPDDPLIAEPTARTKKRAQ
ncbi:ATP-dependent helicase HrpB [Inquilinus sp. CAU 1745]|uniref:ATP-dependent helicase HrpB n=1 Tax=Inquilinus sp. CAU 1745 TaxID=3140369 RepID=UPI00325C1438